MKPTKAAAEIRTFAGIPGGERPPWTTTKRNVRVEVYVEDEDPTLQETTSEFEQRVLEIIQEFPQTVIARDQETK